jgi:hypothetical protein
VVAQICHLSYDRKSKTRWYFQPGWEKKPDFKILVYRELEHGSSGRGPRRKCKALSLDLSIAKTKQNKAKNFTIMELHFAPLCTLVP